MHAAIRALGTLTALLACAPAHADTDRLVTTNPDEKPTGWLYEGLVGYASNRPISAARVQVYRRYDAARTDHLLTTDPNEGTGAGWTDEGTAFYCMPADTPTPPQSVPLHRLYNVSGSAHLYTIFQSEVDRLTASTDWKYEGVLCNVSAIEDEGTRYPLYRWYTGPDQPSQLTDADGDRVAKEWGDCDDGEATTFPGAPELPNGKDDNCDGQVDEGLRSSSASASSGPTQTWYADFDGDGYGGSSETTTEPDHPSNYIERPGDCDDMDPSINPGATEVPGNGKDDDCDGQVDES